MIIDHMLHHHFYLQCSIHIKGKRDALRSLYAFEYVQSSSEIQGSRVDFLIFTGEAFSALIECETSP